MGVGHSRRGVHRSDILALIDLLACCVSFAPSLKGDGEGKDEDKNTNTKVEILLPPSYFHTDEYTVDNDR